MDKERNACLIIGYYPHSVDALQLLSDLTTLNSVGQDRGHSITIGSGWGRGLGRHQTID